jgi:hypothetical protein
MAVTRGVRMGYPGGLTQVNNASLELNRYWRKIIMKNISKGLI